MFPLCLTPAHLFLDVMAQLTRALPYESEALKKDESKVKDSEINPRKEYSKVCVKHKKQMKILSKTAS